MFAILVLTAACNSQSFSNAPCHDGWTSTLEGDSHSWTPTEVEAEAYLALSPVDTQPICWHRLPSGSVVLVHRTNKQTLSATEFAPGPHGPVITEAAIIIQAD
jgi:hypothetical protein